MEILKEILDQWVYFQKKTLDINSKKKNPFFNAARQTLLSFSSGL